VSAVLKRGKSEQLERGVISEINLHKVREFCVSCSYRAVHLVAVVKSFCFMELQKQKAKSNGDDKNKNPLTSIAI
jgi:hypothetical protein